jgi:fructose-1,6-bisphosphatase/sedoheptulose 1,7-bisphosphatase-like protein
MTGVVVIGEGEKDEAPMLYNGEEVGSGHGPEVDVAVDPLEGTRLTAKGQPNAIAVIALAERGTMFFPGAAVYMDKIACGPDAIDLVDIDAPPRENIEAVARAKGKKPSEVSVVVLERDRHDGLVAELREIGAQDRADHRRRRRSRDRGRAAGDRGRPLMGVGGTPEGVIAAAALKCVGGGVQGKLWPRNDEERQALIEGGFDLDRVLTTDDLVSGDDVFVAATGVTDRRLASGRPLHARRRDHRLDRDALTLRHGAPDRGDALFREAGELLGPRLPALSGCRLHLRRVRAGAGGAVELRAAVERLLRVLGLGRVAAPGLQRRRLQRAAVRERQLPRMRAAGVHRVQVRGRVLVRLAAREEDDPGPRPARGA